MPAPDPGAASLSTTATGAGQLWITLATPIQSVVLLLVK